MATCRLLALAKLLFSVGVLVQTVVGMPTGLLNAGAIPNEQPRCVDFDQDEHYCNQFHGRNSKTYFPNARGHETFDEANSEFQDFIPLLRSGCHQKLGTLLCFIYFPFCEDAYPSLRIYPCKELCDEVAGNNSQCTSLVVESQAKKWNDQLQCDLPLYRPASSMQCADGIAPTFPGAMTPTTTGTETTTTKKPDVNECEEGTHDCDENADCTDTEESYTCTCRGGYSGDGRNCRDKDECAAGTHECDKNAMCTNTDGGYTCQCNDGYTGDGIDCEEEATPCPGSGDPCPECDYRKNANGGTFRRNGFCFAARVTVKSNETQDCKYAYSVEVKEQFNILTPYNSTHSTKAPSLGDSAVFYTGPKLLHCPECLELKVNKEYLIAGLYRREEDGSVTWRLDPSNHNSLVSPWINKYDRKLTNWVNNNNSQRSKFVQNCEKDRQFVSAEQWSVHQ